MIASWSITTRPRIVWLPITALVFAPARAAARRIFASVAVMPSSPALSLIQPARTPLSSIPSSSSESIQSASSSSLASMRKGRHPGLAIDAGRHHDRKVRRLRDRAVDIGAAADADGRAFDQRGETERLDALDLGRHQRDDVRGIGLGIAGLVPGAQVDEDVLVRQDRPKLARRSSARAS